MLNLFTRATARTLAVMACAFTALGGDTLFWRQSRQADFDKATLRDVALRSDGKLSLSPAFREVYDSPSAFLWSVARDSKGNVYTGGGPGAKLFRITPAGEKSTVAEFQDLQVQSIAIGSKDQLFVATSPDGKVYRVGPDGKAMPFYEPKTKYIWSIALNSKGELFVATGGSGEIHRVSQSGNGAVLFKSEETHIRSLAIDAKDNLIAGTEPGGLVMRVQPDGQAFVLHQMDKREVTALAINRQGSIYAAAAGTKQKGPTPPPAPIAVVSVTPPTTTPGGAAAPKPTSSAPPAPIAPPPPLTGGSEIVRIEPNGFPRTIWTNSQDIAYALGFDQQGRVLVGTGNKGSIYRLDSDLLHWLLTTAAPTQVTAFALEPDGSVLTVTGNSGRVYRLGPGLAKQGTIESDILDAEVFSEWGKLTFDRSGSGGTIEVAGRSGNLDRPGKTWSPWSPAISTAEGARIEAPAARFFQWKATLNSAASGSPELNWVELAYLQHNVAPVLEQIEATPPNYRFPAPSTITPSKTLALPAIGKPPRQEVRSAPTTPTMQYAKGFVGIRWAGSDLNDDDLSYKVELRGANEKEWRLFKENLREHYLTWDSAPFADGRYRARVTASDAPSNPSPSALTSHLESEPFLIDNTPPKITALASKRSGRDVRVTWTAQDALTVVLSAEYAVDGGDWNVVSPSGKLSDSQQLSFDLLLPNLAPGEHTVAVRVADEFENQAVEKILVQ
jgi:sugar lactone lactonase YvrE